MTVALVLLVLFCLLCPAIGGLVALIPYFSPKIKRYSKLLSVLVALPLGIMAYYFEPLSTNDLTRHHAVVQNFITHQQSLNSLGNSLKDNPLELLPQLYSYAISFTHNVDLLQFVVVLAGYAIMFYILRDYRQRTQLPTRYFIPAVIFTIFGFYALYFFSGLYFYIAGIIFALAFYLDYITGVKPWLKYLLYAVTPLIHNSMFFPVALILIYKLLGNKLSPKSILIPLIATVFLGSILGIIANLTNITLFSTIAEVYSAYVSRNSEMSKYYSGGIFLVEASKISFALLMTFLARQQRRHQTVYGFIVVFALCTLAALPSSIVMIRFVMPIQLVSIIPTMDYFSNKSANRKLLPAALMSALAIFYAAYFVHTMSARNYGDLFGPKLIANPVDLYHKEPT